MATSMVLTTIDRFIVNIITTKGRQLGDLFY